MTYPNVDELPEEATSMLLGVCAQLMRSGHAGLARWADAVCDALLVRLVSVTTGVCVDGTNHEPTPLRTLAGAELDSLRELLLAGAEASDDEAVVGWCTRMNGLIAADLSRRQRPQAAVDAKADAIEAEEWRRARYEVGVTSEGRRLNNYTL